MFRYKNNVLDETFFTSEIELDNIKEVVICFKNLMEIIQAEIFLRLKKVLKISHRILNDTDDSINSKSIDIESIVKDKIRYFFDGQ